MGCGSWASAKELHFNIDIKGKRIAKVFVFTKGKIAKRNLRSGTQSRSVNVDWSFIFWLPSQAKSCIDEHTNLTLGCLPLLPLTPPRARRSSLREQ